MPAYAYSSTNSELIRDLNLQDHNEGGCFAETDRQEIQISSPFVNGSSRALATTIFYLLTYKQPTGFLHMNKSVTMHVLNQGRAEYTLIHPTLPPRIERVVMGTDTAAGEKRQLLVGTGVWKMSRIPDADLKIAQEKGEAEQEKTGCLITEVVTPGFVWEDHKFMRRADLEALFSDVPDGKQIIQELSPYLNKV